MESTGTRSAVAVEHRHRPDAAAELAGMSVRPDDIEPVKGIRAVAVLFRGMAVILFLLMIAQLIIGLTGAVPISIGVLVAEAVRLLIFAGLLWGLGDLAVLFVKSHYDLRATRILTSRIAYMMREDRESQTPSVPSGDARSGGVL
jgi:hypothetical protein